MEKYQQPTPGEAQQWADALRSGKYTQGRGALQLEDMSVCCLGVACLMFIPEQHQDKWPLGNLRFSVPSLQFAAPDWLKQINHDLANKLGTKFSALNDAMQFSFDEIADIIELVYVHKALEEDEDNQIGDKDRS